MDEETTLPAGFSYCQLKNIKFKDIRLYYKNSDSGLRHTKFINCIPLGNVFAEPDILAKVETSNETEHHPNPWKFNVYDKFRNTDSYIFHPPENIEQLKKQNKKPIKKISRIQKKDSAKQEENQYSFFSFHQREEEKKRAQANSDEELATTLMRLEFL